MKKVVVALAVVALASQAGISFAGGPEVSSKQVITPAPQPESFFRGNEFDIGAFATYVTGTNGGGTRQTAFDDGNTFTLSSSGSPNGWGGGMDFTYFFPWEYAGVRFQGAGVELNTGNVTITCSNGFSRSGSGSAAAGVLTGDFVLRLPLDDFWSGVHLAPYTFGGFGGVFTGAGGNTINNPSPEVNQRFNHTSSNVSNDRFLGNIGGGNQYRVNPPHRPLWPDWPKLVM